MKKTKPGKTSRNDYQILLVHNLQYFWGKNGHYEIAGSVKPMQIYISMLKQNVKGTWQINKFELTWFFFHLNFSTNIFTT